ncbi:LysR family transcriptional regulator [Yersinia nurmii]|uniref:DNA-binding transcriptional regulator OxyR n=1 Tax=Yersinia nurmii TaxID=685706 RepID=A0AAW7K256_9GAMM|nr:LysR family transcriptional regulator [Yersinia nurmii]MDN0089188.1 LysR family transcriptional regulator [Yersinia nurmii]CNF20448.1 DNA-binding transcriptional regulator OxyR [Yersinia nurmii]
MNLKQIRYALAVAETQSFTQAARRCHTVQSALSHQIARLEQELGCQLFERTSRRVSLTDAGQAFILPAQRLLAEQQNLLNEVNAASGNVTGTLTLGTISTLNAFDLTEKLGEFNRCYPAVNIRLYVGMSEALIEDTRQQKTDVSFVGIWPGDKNTLPLSHCKLTDEPLVALVAPDHVLAGKASVDLQTLAAVPLVDFYSGTGARRQTDRAFQTAGIKRHVNFEIDHIEWLENLVRRGLAAGIVPISTAQRLISLVSIPIDDGPRRQVYCIWHTPLSAAAERFLHFSGFTGQGIASAE